MQCVGEFQRADWGGGVEFLQTLAMMSCHPVSKKALLTVPFVALRLRVALSVRTFGLLKLYAMRLSRAPQHSLYGTACIEEPDIFTMAGRHRSTLGQVPH
jgi:hypothetical protein